jgi:hypothetical protein
MLESFERRRLSGDDEREQTIKAATKLFVKTEALEEQATETTVSPEPFHR